MPDIKFPIGGVWENNGFEISTDHKERGDTYVPCKHAHSKREYVEQYYTGGALHKITEYVVPFVVVQVNEGGYCNTGTCAQCIVEAMQTLLPNA